MLLRNLCETSGNELQRFKLWRIYVTHNISQYKLSLHLRSVYKLGISPVWNTRGRRCKPVQARTFWEYKPLVNRWHALTIIHACFSCITANWSILLNLCLIWQVEVKINALFETVRSLVGRGVQNAPKCHGLWAAYRGLSGVWPPWRVCAC